MTFIIVKNAAFYLHCLGGVFCNSLFYQTFSRTATFKKDNILL